MKLIRYLSLLVIAVSFLFSCYRQSPEVESGHWVQLIDSPELVRVVQHFMPYLRHEKRLRLEDSRVFYNETINTVRMEFTSQDVLEVREARFLLVDVVEGLLAALNQNPTLGSQFITYPLTPDQLEIYINFESFHGLYVDPYYVGFIMLEDGQATYWAFDTKENGRNYWDFRTEAYEKSREFTVYEREAENMFKQLIDIEHPLILPEQYITPVKEIPRYFSPYRGHFLFDKEIKEN